MIRRTQEERSAATRALLLDATVECLVRYGYAGTTTMRVAELAGVSRGAMVHHYAAKSDLMIAAVGHLAARRLSAPPPSAGPGDRLDAALDLIWQAHQGPPFEAGMELWVAARTDAELRGHLVEFERALRTSMYDLARNVLNATTPGTAPDPVPDFVLDTVLDAVRGLRLLTFLEPGPATGPDPRWLRLRRTLREGIS